MSKSILVVDDEPVIRRIMVNMLQQAGYQAQTAATAEVALELIQAAPPDLVLLDIELPGMDGLEALRQIPNRIPVIFVTGRDRTQDEVLGLELGAQDYISKPFARDLLLARVRAALRRAQRSAAAAPLAAEPASVQAGDLRIDLASHSVTVAGRPVNLTPLEFRLLHVLAAHAGKALTSEKLLTTVWGPNYAGEPQVLYVYVRALREKIEADPQQPRRLLTVRGVGYKYVAQEAAVGLAAREAVSQISGVARSKPRSGDSVTDSVQ